MVFVEEVKWQWWQKSWHRSILTQFFAFTWGYVLLQSNLYSESVVISYATWPNQIKKWQLHFGGRGDQHAWIFEMSIGIGTVYKKWCAALSNLLFHQITRPQWLDMAFWKCSNMESQGIIRVSHDYSTLGPYLNDRNSSSKALFNAEELFPSIFDNRSLSHKNLSAFS